MLIARLLKFGFLGNFGRPKNTSQCDPKYLFYLLQARKDEYFVPLMIGTANVSLKESDIASVLVHVPPIENQHRTVRLIDTLNQKIEEARSCLSKREAFMDALLISMAHRKDMDDAGKVASGWKRSRLEMVLTFTPDPCQVHATEQYNNCGLLNFARGLFKKPPIIGIASSANVLYRIKAGQFIYSRLFAFEGAYGMVTSEFDGYSVSGEYPAFDRDSKQIRAEFLWAYFKSPDIWSDLASGSKGIGHRRQRVLPDKILAHELWLPPIEYQNKVAQVLKKLQDARPIQDLLRSQLDALMPAILDRASRGEL